MFRREQLRALGATLPFAVLVLVSLALVAPQRGLTERGRYALRDWGGPPVGVVYHIPVGSDKDTPIVIIIPGAQRNAGVYREQWDHLAQANKFICLTLEGTHDRFPSEYEYNCGGVMTADGKVSDEEKWLFSAIEPLFDDFKKRFGSKVKTYALYGHSAGGGFVHRFMLFKPDASVSVAVAANPAFYTMPDSTVPYPFGLKAAPLAKRALERWFGSKLIVMLGEQDLGPRTKALSNGRDARKQGSSCFTRGQRFFEVAQKKAKKVGATLEWQLESVPFVGHSNAHMASHAVKHLLQN